MWDRGETLQLADADHEFLFELSCFLFELSCAERNEASWLQTFASQCKSIAHAD